MSLRSPLCGPLMRTPEGHPVPDAPNSGGSGRHPNLDGGEELRVQQRFQFFA